METKHQASRRRDDEREEMTDILNRGRREIDRNMNEMKGWADRIMRALLTPTGKDMTLWYNPIRNKNGNGAHYKREQ